MIGEVTNHLWQSTLFALFAGLLTIVVRRNRAQVRYWIWFSASLKFFVPFSMLMNLGSYLEWAPTAERLATPAVSLTVMQISQPFADTLPIMPSTQSDHEWVSMAVLVVWVCGFAVMAWRRIREWLSIRSTVHSSTPLQVPVPVEVRSSPGLLEPGIVGLWRPILLLPSDIFTRLTPRQLEAVLAHEMCHVRRRDNLTAAIHMIVESVFWFHPLVWWIGARLVDERERACDEAVLSLGNEPRDYAEAILNVCKLYVESPLVCVSGVTGANLERRITAIMTNRIALRLNFAKKVALVVTGIAVLTVPIIVGTMNARLLRAQPASTVPKFDVVSVRPCKVEPGRRRGAAELYPGKLNTGCAPLVNSENLGLIHRAYVMFADVPSNSFIVPIKGGPDWIRSELFEIQAKAEGNPSLRMMQGPMLQALLEDRFKLKIHRETTQGPVYALTVAKGGSKLKPFEEGSCTTMPLTTPPPAPPAGQKYCISRLGIRPLAVDAQGSTVAEFAKLLGLALDRPVVDQTGITGKFDIHMEFSIDEATPKLVDENARFDLGSNPSAPSIFTAIRQLGLKLEAAKGPRELLVIDHVERPSAN